MCPAATAAKGSTGEPVRGLHREPENIRTTDDETVTALAVRFDTLGSESYRASESAALIERLAGT
jgi:hypothetical protein